MTRAHSWPPGAPQHLGPGEDRTVAETLPCAPSGPDTAELAPGASACRTHPRSVLTNSWGCRGTLGSIWMHFWVQGCVSPTPVCPFESDKSVSIQGPERPIRDRLGITAPGFRQGCGLCKDRPTSALLLCHLKLSTRSMDEPTDQGRQEGAPRRQSWSWSGFRETPTAGSPVVGKAALTQKAGMWWAGEGEPLVRHRSLPQETPACPALLTS